MVATDPTMASLELFKDESRWEIVRNVPVFVPHVRKDDEGKKLYGVDANRLSAIKAVNNERAKVDGVLSKLIIGHTPKEKSSARPRIVGWAKDYRVGTFGPEKKIALVVDHYYRKEDAEEAKKYPFRSPEFYPTTNEITAIALLVDDPALDMGMLLFERDPKGPCFLYSSKGLPVGDFAAQVMPDEEKMDKEDEEFYARMKKCMAKYGAIPSATDLIVPQHMPYERNGTPPVTPTPATTLAGGSAPDVLIRENKELYERNAALTKQLSSFEAEYKADKLAIQYERQLRSLDPDGRTIDIPAELADLRTMSEPDATKHMKRIERYARTPVGQPLIPVDDRGSVVVARGNEPATDYESKQAVELCTHMQEKGTPISYEASLAEVKKRRGK